MNGSTDHDNPVTTPTEDAYESTEDTYEILQETVSEPEPEPEPNEVVEKSQNDHLNKKLLCSFMEKLNQIQAEPDEDCISNIENEDDEFEDE